MKRLKLPLLSLFVLVFICSTSCEKSVPYPSSAGSSASKISHNTNSLLNSHQYIMFQFGELNTEDKIEKGWLITNTGEIHTFHMDAEKAWSPMDESRNYGDLSDLAISMIDKIGTVSMEDLVENVNKVELAAKYRPSADADAEMTFVAFKVNPDGEMKCNSNGGSKVDYYDQVLLSYEEGSNTGETDAAVANQEILTWLKEIKLDF